MKRFFFIALLSLGVTTIAVAGMPFWLDSPTRNNANDPKSVLYSFFKAQTPLVPTATHNTTPQRTDTPSETATFTVTPSPSATQTFNSNSPTPTPTMTPTSTPGCPGFINTIYDGNTTTLVDDFFYTSVSTSGAAGITEVTSPGAGALGANHYLDITITATNSYASALIGFCGGATNVSAYSSGALTVYFQIPGSSAIAGGCNNFRPMIRLASNSLAPNNESLAITATAYLTYTAGTFVAGAWTEVVIPLSAFVGMNDGGGTFGTAADFNSLKGVEILPWRDSYNTSADYNGEVYVGNISFSNSNVPVTRAFSGLVDDFEENNGKAVSNWITPSSAGQQYWAAFADTYTCAPVTAITYPTGYPANNNPLDYATTVTGCMAVHLQGDKGGSKGTMGCGFASMGIECWLNGVNNSCDLSSNLFVTTLAAGGATGMIFSLMLGPNDPGVGQPGTGVQTYRFILNRASVSTSGDGYSIQIEDSSLSNSAFTQFTIPFPTDGSTPALHPSATATDLNWAQPFTTAVGAVVSWGRTDFQQIEIEPVTRGTLGGSAGAPVDIFVHDVSFY